MWKSQSVDWEINKKLEYKKILKNKLKIYNKI